MIALDMMRIECLLLTRQRHARNVSKVVGSRLSASSVRSCSSERLKVVGCRQALWATDLAFRRDRALLAGVTGLVSAAVQFGILLINGERLNPQNLALIVAAQAIWYVAVGLVIYFRRGPYQLIPAEMQ